MLAVYERRGFLRLIFIKTTSLTASATAYATLAAALQALITSNFSVSSTGTVVSTSANGHSTTFALNAVGRTAGDFSQSAAFLYDVHDRARAALVSSGIASPTDAQIWTEMMDRPEMSPITELTPSTLEELRYA